MSYDPVPPSTPTAATHFRVQDPESTPRSSFGDYSSTTYPPRFQGKFESDGTSNYSSEYNASIDALNPNHERYHDDPTGRSASPIGEAKYNTGNYAPSSKKKRKTIIIAIVASIILLILAIIIPIYFLVIKPKSSSGSSGSGSSSGSGGSSGGKGGGKGALAVTGGDGSEVVLEDGSKMKYSNSFGGQWYYDPEDPWNNGARAQSWSPALNETFHYGQDRVRGVNLGGWLVIEPFIAPSLFQKYPDKAIDEYTLHTLMGQDKASGGFDQLEQHYSTFITEKDFAEIAAAGLNYVRIPFPFWAIETIQGEPYYAKGAWKYFLKAIGWARKYGIRINLDFHAHPGSQNGWDHSGRRQDINWLMGPMGMVNAQRSLNYIRIIAEFISQPQYRDVVTMFGIVNEPRAPIIGNDAILAFYAEAYRVVREASGIGKGPWISLHDAFMSRDDFIGFLPNADRVSLDSHPYIAFNTPQTTDSWSSRTDQACGWGKEFNKSMDAFGFTAAGEFSNAINDCALFLNGVGKGVRFEGTYDDGGAKVGNCADWVDYPNYTQDRKDDIKKWAMASMDGLHNFFFWTWKIGNSTAGKIESPHWSYQLGLENGWMPTDPREADGFCGNLAPTTGTITSGSGDVNTGKHSWPPASFTNVAQLTQIPSYTPTGAIPTITGGTLSVSGIQASKTADVGNGWNNPDDKDGLYAPVSGCTYLDPYIGQDHALPGAGWCGSNGKREPVPRSIPTPPPAL